jgi:hypothetical protein
MTRVRRAHALPPSWDKEQLERDRGAAIELFRDERMKEPLEKYLEAFEKYRDAFDELLETTVDLRELSAKAIDILTSDALCEALRYLPGPPISMDDLKVVAQAPSFALKTLRADPELAQRILDTVLMGLDRRRFPWVSDDREATEHERTSAVLASAAMIAMRKVETARRNESKEDQEQHVRDVLANHALKEVGTRHVQTLGDAPKQGEFCRESVLGDRKADIILGLWDRRVMPIECKVSNSYTNSIKRLNNDAAIKAQVWRKDFGESQVVPSAVLSGVYKLKNLENAQDRGLTLFWAHSLDEMMNFIDQTNGKP